MIDWATWQPAMRALITELANGTGPDITSAWSEEKQPFTDPATGVKLELRVNRISGLGRDERRLTFNEDTNTLTEEIHGQRTMSLDVRFISQEATNDLWAFTFSERVRTRLRRDASIEALLAVNTAIIDIGDTVNLSDANDGHIETIAAFELRLGLGFQDNNPFPVGEGWIDAITYDSKVQDVDGVELPVPPNVTGHLVPSDWTPPT